MADIPAAWATSQPNVSHNNAEAACIVLQFSHSLMAIRRSDDMEALFHQRILVCNTHQRFVLDQQQEQLLGRWLCHLVPSRSSDRKSVGTNFNAFMTQSFRSPGII